MNLEHYGPTRETRKLSQKETLTPHYRILIFNGNGSAALLDSHNGHTSIGSQLGGGEIVSETQTKYLRLLGHNANILTVSPRNHDLSSNGYHLFLSSPLPREDHNPDPEKHPELLSEVLYHTRGSDIIFAQHRLAGEIIATLKEQGQLDPNVKIAYMGHVWMRMLVEMDPSQTNSSTRDKAERMSIDSSDVIIVATHSERETIARLYADGDPKREYQILEKTKIVPLGVETRIFNPQARQELREHIRSTQLGELSNTINFYMLARFVPLKRQMETIEAFCDAYFGLKEQGLPTNISLSLFGNPGSEEYYKKIRNYVNALPEELQRRIIFHGVKPPLDAHAIGDVYLGTSTFESGMLSAREAMACGIPTVLSDIGPLRETGEDSVMYCDPFNRKSIKDSIIDMALNDDLRENLGVMAYRQSMKFTMVKSIIELEIVLKDLMKSKHATLRRDINYLDRTSTINSFTA